MKLSMYLARYFFGAFSLTLFGLVILMVAVSLIENADRFSGVKHGAGSIALRLAFFSGAEFVEQVLPVACLLGVLISGTLLARRGELLAVQAAGISVYHTRSGFCALCGGGGCGWNSFFRICPAYIGCLGRSHS